jgi:hypothetical protein
MPPKKEKGPRSASDVRNAKVVLTGIAEGADRYRVCKTLAAELGVPFEEATGMVTRLPEEIFSAIPEEAADVFAEKLREAGGLVEVLSLADGLGPFCGRHPHRRARAKCKGCAGYICEEEILGSGKRLYCPDCYATFKTRRRLRGFAALGALLVIVAGWMLVRPTIGRMVRYQTRDRDVRVRIACIADRMDPVRIRLFNEIGDQASKYAGDRFTTLADVLNREYRRYTGLDKDFLTLEVTGIHETDPETGVPTSAGLAVGGFCRAMDEKLAIGAGQYDFVLWVHLVASEDLPGGSDVPNVALVSGNCGVVWFAVDPPRLREHYLAATLAALGELLGGSLKLNSQGNPNYPDGFPLPTDEAYVATTSFEIMAGYLPDALAGRAWVQDVKKGVVGPRTAWEFGWIDAARRDHEARAATAAGK